MSRFTGPGYDFEIDVPEGWRLVTADEHRRGVDAQVILADLDRCEHGRHFGDVCSGTSGCNGPSRGNPFLRAGRRIGTDLSRRAIVVPQSDIRVNLGDPSLWKE